MVSVPKDANDMDAAKVTRVQAALARARDASNQISHALTLYRTGREILRLADKALECRAPALEEERVKLEAGKNLKASIQTEDLLEMGEGVTMQQVKSLLELDICCQGKRYLRKVLEPLALPYHVTAPCCSRWASWFETVIREGTKFALINFLENFEVSKQVTNLEKWEEIAHLPSSLGDDDSLKTVVKDIIQITCVLRAPSFEGILNPNQADPSLAFPQPTP